MPEPNAPVDPAIETPVDPVETPDGESKPSPAVDPPTPKTPEKSAREVELENELQKERDRAEAHRKDAEKKRREKLEVQRANGDFEAILRERETELTQATAERDTLRTQAETLTAENKTLRTELEGYRATLIDRFDTADRALAEATPLASLPALFERLNGRPIMQPPPSTGATKITTHATAEAPQTLEEYNSKKYGVGVQRS